MLERTSRRSARHCWRKPITEAARVDLVWTTSEPGSHQQWLSYLLGDCLGTERIDTRFETAEPRSLYVVNTNRQPLSRLPRPFLESVERTPGVGLFIGSDEWFTGDYEAFRRFAFVLRFHHPARFKHPGVLTAPLGYANGAPHRATFTPASERSHLWSFAGAPVGSRIEMLAALDGLEPAAKVVVGATGDSTEGRLSKSAYHDLMADSAFVPCPMGNVVLETYRVYEALENGAIPIVERRRLRPYFDDVFGPNPLPAFPNWHRARSFMTRLQANSEELDALQFEIVAWWRAQKVTWRERMADFLQRGLRDELRGQLATFPVRRNKIVRQLDQFQELARHHSPGAARRRLVLSVKRLLSTGSVISAERRLSETRPLSDRGASGTPND